MRSRWADRLVYWASILIMARKARKVLKKLKKR